MTEQDKRDRYEERAAWLEFGEKLTRKEAEKRAEAEIYMAVDR